MSPKRKLLDVSSDEGAKQLRGRDAAHRLERGRKTNEPGTPEFHEDIRRLEEKWKVGRKRSAAREKRKGLAVTTFCYMIYWYLSESLKPAEVRLMLYVARVIELTGDDDVRITYNQFIKGGRFRGVKVPRLKCSEAVLTKSINRLEVLELLDVRQRWNIERECKEAYYSFNMPKLATVFEAEGCEMEQALELMVKTPELESVEQ